MDSRVYNLSLELKELINKDERFLRLNEVEKELENNEEVMSLAYLKDRANDEYNDALRLFKEDSEEVRKARLKLKEAKEKLDTHPLTQKYLEAYKNVRDLLLEVNDILFGDIKKKEYGYENYRGKI